VLLIVGIFLIVVGISDFAIAALLTRQHAPAGSGLGDAQPPVAARMLRRTGVLTLIIGVVLAVVGLVT
jgi:hypothetical protein